ncbi:hypothetical protein CAPTEDRAFT_214359 [Capitella teleta]|uniref:Diacylglycerol kinase n=1 Tax=Capitella teleta TaxID=283909 RepID=R7TG47_CAPTE|nr:hypothetical protein CAPTEDRAFT_214359 [Capitella teleta]|eukprot:ELT92758.1 hypothetical protein CAPTEDRAFT_214359 [Capitella teleta]
MMKQTSSFQRWRRRYFKLKGRKLYYAKDTKSVIFDEIQLVEMSIAGCSINNENHSFQVITPFRNLVLCTEGRKEMDDWILALRSAANREFYEPNAEQTEMLSGHHHWYACSHARPTYCNVCREALSSVTSHGLSCEVCKFKAHKRCAVKAENRCKWTTLASIGPAIIEQEDGSISMPHQWIEGNLPVSAKCCVCEKTCGSVLRMQDWRCLWCKSMVHTSCRDNMPSVCTLGQYRISILPPTAISYLDSDGYWRASKPEGVSPLLVFVNSKSGDNQGIKMFRKFKQLLNPAQIFDLTNGGPRIGLRLYQHFESFRVLVCGGDGSIGWVLNEIDHLGLHKQCQVGVLPLGTGNDLARVLGWGSAFDDDTQLLPILERLEHAQINMLDRWSIKTFEGNVLPPRHPHPKQAINHRSCFSLLCRLILLHPKILHSDNHHVVISSAHSMLCETVKELVDKVGQDSKTEQVENSISNKCSVLNKKLDALLMALKEESKASDPKPSHHDDSVVMATTVVIESRPAEEEKEHLMSRANSLKKAIRQIIEHTEKAVDDQNAQTLAYDQDHHGYEDEPLSPNIPIILEPEMTPTLEINSNPSSPLPEIPGAMSTLAVPQSFFFPSDGESSACGNRSGAISSRQPVHASRLGSHSFISKVLLANADALCAAASPLMRPSVLTSRFAVFIHREDYQEKCVMNNYFGIGLDAKIALEFHQKREEHPEKCRSRTKNMMWYGVIGSKEMLKSTYKNLEQRVQLECDGTRIPLPNLQGLVVLNISSYMGGTNFWGGTKEDNFVPPSFDDKILEVVAVFGGVQLGISRVLNIHRHRIAQCRSVKITIMGEEGMPVQVDGEAWMQPPGYIRIMHKNRAQMLTRDKVFEEALKTWTEKQKIELPTVSRRHDSLNETETQILQSFVEATESLIKSVKVASICHSTVEQDLFHLATQASGFLDRLYPSGTLTVPTVRTQVSDLVSSVRTLYNETRLFMSHKAAPLNFRSDVEEKIRASLLVMEGEMKRVYEIGGLPHIQDIQEEACELQQKRSKGKPSLMSKLLGKKEKRHAAEGSSPNVLTVLEWGLNDVGHWLASLGMSEYREMFVSHDVRGQELLSLGRTDLKELGIHKVGHLKRIQQGIKDLRTRMSALDKTATIL